jgi:hypothetical protein
VFYKRQISELDWIASQTGPNPVFKMPWLLIPHQNFKFYGYRSNIILCMPTYNIHIFMDNNFFMNLFRILTLTGSYPNCSGHLFAGRRTPIHTWNSTPRFDSCNSACQASALKCIWHEISYFLKWKNSLSCSVTYFWVFCFYGLFPRYFNLFDM